MEIARESELLAPSEETVCAVRALYDLHAPGRMEEAVRMLDDWIKKQPHFIKKDFHPKYLETSIINCKGSIEKAKMKIDKYCTLKNEVSDFYDKFNAKSDFDKLHEFLHVAVCTKYTGEYYVLMILKIRNTVKPDAALFKDFYKYGVNLLEYGKRFIYINGIHFAIDYTDVNISDILSGLNLLDLHKFLLLCLEGVGMRLKGVHLISSSKLIEKIIIIIKHVMSKMLSERIHVHKNIQSFQNFFPKEVLPSTYGGTELSVKELDEILMEVLSQEEHISYMRSMQDARTDEKLRPRDNHNEHEVQGAFRNLTID